MTKSSPADNHSLLDSYERPIETIEGMYFAYRSITAIPDRILEKRGYGRAHHRTIHFIDRASGTTVNNLLSILALTKQSLNRVLRTLIKDGLVQSSVGEHDRRERHLSLTPAGKALLKEISIPQQAWVSSALLSAGDEALEGFQVVINALMDENDKRLYAQLKDETKG